MNQLQTTLVGIDFSECSRRALEQAVRLARWNNAQLSIIHVQDPSELELSGVEFPPPLDEQFLFFEVRDTFPVHAG